MFCPFFEIKQILSGYWLLLSNFELNEVYIFRITLKNTICFVSTLMSKFTFRIFILLIQVALLTVRYPKLLEDYKPPTKK